jgi:heptosyltransferase I
MLHPALDRGLDQRARVGGVVAVIAERIAHRVRHDDGAGEMDDRLDPWARSRATSSSSPTSPTTGSIGRQRRGEAGRQVVEHHHALAGVDQFVHHVAADVAGAAGDQHGHIKTSSLGDVIHHMPAATDARRRRPGVRIDWAVEEAFAPLVRLHPAVDEAIPVAARRWRASLHRPSAWREMARFVAGLRAVRYDEIVDTQGLFFKSALIARLARGRRHGYDRDSVRERAASWLYDVRHPVGRERHAVDRNRALTGLALGYAPEGPPDFGLDRARLAAASGGASYGVLLHGTARPEKEWPEEHWRALALRLGGATDLMLLHGTPAEHARARSGSPRPRRVRTVTERAAARCRGAHDRRRLVRGRRRHRALHLAAALGVPLVAIFGASEPGLTGPVGQGPMEVVGGKGAVSGVDEVLQAVGRVSGAGSGGTR